MIRFLLRFLGVVCLAGAFFFVIYDGTISIADKRWYVTRVSDIWSMVHESSLAQFQPWLSRVAPWLWDSVVVHILNASTWLVLVVVGSALILLGRKKKPLIGYARD